MFFNAKGALSGFEWQEWKGESEVGSEKETVTACVYSYVRSGWTPVVALVAKCWCADGEWRQALYQGNMQWLAYFKDRKQSGVRLFDPKRGDKIFFCKGGVSLPMGGEFPLDKIAANGQGWTVVQEMSEIASSNN